MKAKRMKDIGIGLICLVVVILLGYSFYQHRQLKNMTPETTTDNLAVSDTSDLAGDSSDPAGDIITEKKSTGSATSEIPLDNADIDMLEAKLDETETELDTAYRQIDDEMSRQEALKQKELELQRQYIESPAFKNSIISYLSSRYEDLFDELNLSDEKREALLNLLANDQMAYSELIPEIQVATTDEQKDDLRQRYAAALEANDGEIEEFLGTDYEAYHDYKEMQTTRGIIDTFKSTLDEELQLTEAQENELTEIMYKEQMQVFAEMGYDPRYEIEFPSDVKEGAVDGQASNMAEIHDRSLEKSEGILSEAQFEAYRNYLNKQQEMMELATQLSD